VSITHSKCKNDANLDPEWRRSVLLVCVYLGKFFPPFLIKYCTFLTGPVIPTIAYMLTMSSQQHSKNYQLRCHSVPALHRRRIQQSNTTTTFGSSNQVTTMAKWQLHVRKSGRVAVHGVSHFFLSNLKSLNTVMLSTVVCLSLLIEEHPDLPARVYPPRPLGEPGISKFQSFFFLLAADHGFRPP
jgi:hypothetical protein